VELEIRGPDGAALPDGVEGEIHVRSLSINSRARDMILVNAENVFPTEVEFRLDEHPAVRECAVLGGDDLRARCREGIAGYKVPTRWVLRDEPLPRNPSGRVLERELLGEFSGG